MTLHLVYDGTFGGFLTAIFECYERKLTAFKIVSAHRYQPDLLNQALDVVTDQSKSKRVWSGLKKHLSTEKRNEVYKTFLSELPQIEQLLSDFIRHAFSRKENIENDLGNASVIEVANIARQVHREKHRMEAFVRFQRTKDDLYFASISPDFNVLPLVVSHFKDRYADQHWLIYDKRRKYGINYDCTTGEVTEVLIDLDVETSNEFLPENMCHEDEVPYQKLWKDYFYSVNIGARRNKKLHVRHVPTRYWRYLVEKREW
jgi:probable DNA metabolism protein